MIKVIYGREVENLKDLPLEVIKVIKSITNILDREYGDNRAPNDDGGYVVVIESKEDFKKLKEIYIDIDDLIPEYVDKITCSKGEVWTNTLVLMNNDFGISIFCNVEIAPKVILDEICGEE
ncbi:hypothetical protein [Paramaledivibacter caminithermalis]|jgi:hypothetical protein|uniref:Uncharacterized protein n=1 Tax=Paramaledivibacter caminithermalis (strain DSM 15212 / CIP 107654 / DViRD3) TaxID=1121301 RepID=A0A1M6NB24_PARC5|nr:hypothetical protein [Paramaledivibacter caminithermalis]SHJ92919.1 hypothetical protein SAMN02745912_01646 [Paramaledivibacter caminithermalis DSM 15212]